MISYLNFYNSNFFFFWVIPRRLSSKSRRFGTLYRFHLHGQVDEECLGMGRAVYLFPP